MPSKCKCCPNEFKQYSTLQKLCSKCEYNKQKENNGKVRAHNDSRSGKQPRSFGTAKVQIAARYDSNDRPRKGKAKSCGVTKALSKGSGLHDSAVQNTVGNAKGKKNAIPNRSKSQEGKDREIAKIKAERIRRYGPNCESCGSPYDIDLAHLIPKSIRPDLYLEIDNTTLHCRFGCGPALEHLQDIERVRKFYNLDEILAYLERVDTKRFLRVCEVLKIKIE